MKVPLQIRPVLAAALALGLAAPSFAQDPPENTSLVGHFADGSVSNDFLYADVWGDGDHAYLGSFGQGGVGAEVRIIDLSNPFLPSLLATWPIPTPDDTASAQDVKAGDGLLFISLESANPNGVQIVDVRDPSDPKLLTNIDLEPGSFEQIHNTFYDQGWLYVCNSSDNQIAILDLTGYDPDSPPASITSWDYRIDDVGNQFVHDVTVQNGLLYCAAWDRLVVYDVSNIGSSPPAFLGSVRGLSCHAVWATDDGEYVVTTEEREAGALRLFQVDDQGSSVELVQRDSLVLPRTSSFSAHNPLIVGDRIYMSGYQQGLVVLEIDRTTHRLEEVATYDTSSMNPLATFFEGAWGAYPLAGVDRVLVSDLDNGLFVVDTSSVQISFVDPRPEIMAPGVGADVRVQLSGLGSAVVDGGTASLFSRIDGGAFQGSAMVHQGGGEYLGSLPPTSCGATVEYYVAVDDTLGGTWTDPIDAPASLHTVWTAGSTTTVFADDFETDLGWSVADQSLSAGSWVRVDPVGTGLAPEKGLPDGSGSFCFVTGQGSNPGSPFEADVDGTLTSLTSPQLDFSSGDGLVRYARWFANDDGDSDALVVEISDDDGGSWATVESVPEKMGGWVERVIRVSDHVTPTDQVRVRFSASDVFNSSITEAAVDHFRAEVFDCTPLATAVVRNGIHGNPGVYATTTLPVIGTNWVTEMDTSGFPGALSTYVLGFAGTLDTGLLLNLGELLVNPATENIIGDVAVPVAGLSTHTIPIPNDIVFQGFFVATQGLVFVPGSSALTNAIDITVDY